MLAKTTSVVVIADLNGSGMLKNHHLAQAIAEVGFSAFKRQLCYKAAWYGARVVLSDRWEPSSKTGWRCGWVEAELPLSDRTFCCRNPHRPDCGLVLNQDLARGNYPRAVRPVGREFLGQPETPGERPALAWVWR